MDPITTAIIAALPAVASDVVKSSVKDAYEGLKAVIRRKWGETDPAVRAVDALESDPTSEGHTVILQEKITAVKATEDAEIMQAAAKLIAGLGQQGIGGEVIRSIYVQIAGGTVQGVVGAERVKIESMNFGSPPKDNKS